MHLVGGPFTASDQFCIDIRRLQQRSKCSDATCDEIVKTFAKHFGIPTNNFRNADSKIQKAAGTSCLRLNGCVGCHEHVYHPDDRCQPRIHSRTHSRIHSLAHSLTRAFTHSLAHSLIHSPTHAHSHSLTHANRTVTCPYVKLDGTVCGHPRYDERGKPHEARVKKSQPPAPPTLLEKLC